jgi:hypothetical protein
LHLYAGVVSPLFKKTVGVNIIRPRQDLPPFQTRLFRTNDIFPYAANDPGSSKTNILIISVYFLKKKHARGLRPQAFFYNIS